MLDLAYLGLLGLASPWLLYRAMTTGRYPNEIWTRFLGLTPILPTHPCRIWCHGASVGEIHMLTPLVQELRSAFPQADCVVSSTSQTGLAEARKRLREFTTFPMPSDFSWAVERALDRVKPRLLILAESELWPQLLARVARRAVPIIVVNARISPRTASRLKAIGSIARRWLLDPVRLFATQSNDHAFLLRKLGVSAKKIHITGNIKFDNTHSDRNNKSTNNLRKLLNITPDERVWVVGSTQHPEEEMCLRIAQAIPAWRLIVVPRHPERFEAVARLLANNGIAFLRRSQIVAGSPPDRGKVILGDTMGELSALWGLADIAYVGGSLDGQRGGQNMIEPAAYGAAVVFGRHVWNFREVARQLVAAGAAVQVDDENSLRDTILRLAHDETVRNDLGRAARNYVASQQGAVVRTVELIQKLLKAERFR